MENVLEKEPSFLINTSMEDLASVERRASRVKLLLMDCDGVLTDGRLWLLENGDEHKSFNTHDGLGLSLLHRAGLKSGIISGRRSLAVIRRADELGVEFVRQGDPHKIEAFEQLLRQAGVDENEVAFVGDDLTDIPIMQRAELAVAVADAVAEARSVAHYVTRAKGGRGAIREVIEIILKSQGRWSDLVDEYLT
ncbi:MAG TPA: HAD family hydrolase [Pyrinomonadaceae bacterium]|jgi:3-deoxy-D-manno-octulosonate 8-phosphate phosphatase (KDO 8-P phosphatase)